MKKSVIAAGTGVFIIITTLLCVNPDGKIYQKQKYFNTVNDVLMQLENNKIQVINEYGKRIETNEFKECLSKRKRLTFSEINFNEIEVEKVEELDDQKRESIIEDYNKAQERLSMPYKSTKIEPVRLDIKANYPKYEGDPEPPVQQDFKIDLVMVDEGEGMVIDYYVEHNIENGRVKEEGMVNDKG